MQLYMVLCRYCVRLLHINETTHTHPHCSAAPPACPPTCATGGCATIPYTCQCTSNCTSQGCTSGYTQVTRNPCPGGFVYTCNRACGNNFNGQCSACLSGRWGVPGTCSGGERAFPFSISCPFCLFVAVFVCCCSVVIFLG